MHLLSKGADINVRNYNGNSVLHTLASLEYNDPKILKIATVLLEYGCEKNGINNQGNTPLHLCSMNDNNKMAELFLKNSAVPNPKNNRSETPLTLAAMKANLKVLKLFLKYGDDINPGGFVLSHYAALSGSLEALKIVLTQFPHQAFAFTTNGQTPLHFSCQVGSGFQVEHLLALSGIDRNARNKWNETPFFVAVR